MTLSIDAIEEVIRLHHLARSRPTLPNALPVPSEWQSEPPPDGALEDRLSRWLEAADALAPHREATMLWSMAMRPWLEALLGLDGTEVSPERTAAIAAFERLKVYWQGASRTP